jgi:hypothetical protein
MTIEQFRKVLGARPFRPFTIHLADGRSAYVPHTEFVSESPSGRTMTVHQTDESSEIIDLLLVTSLAVAAPNSTAPSNGHQA